jgi:hypothetical protein
MSTWADGGDTAKTSTHTVASPDSSPIRWGSEAAQPEPSVRPARAVFQAGMSDSSEGSSDEAGSDAGDGAQDEDELADAYWEQQPARDILLAEVCISGNVFTSGKLCWCSF